MQRLVSQSAPVGVPLAFTVPSQAGSTRSRAGIARISAQSSTQAKKAPTSEIIRPIEMKVVPQGPTICRITPASDGSSSAAMSL